MKAVTVFACAVLVLASVPGPSCAKRQTPNSQLQWSQEDELARRHLIEGEAEENVAQQLGFQVGRVNRFAGLALLAALVAELENEQRVAEPPAIYDPEEDEPPALEPADPSTEPRMQRLRRFLTDSREARRFHRMTLRDVFRGVRTLFKILVPSIDCIDELFSVPSQEKLKWISAKTFSMLVSMVVMRLALSRVWRSLAGVQGSSDVASSMAPSIQGKTCPYMHLMGLIWAAFYALSCVHLLGGFLPDFVLSLVRPVGHKLEFLAETWHELSTTVLIQDKFTLSWAAIISFLPISYLSTMGFKFWNLLDICLISGNMGAIMSIYVTLIRALLSPEPELILTDRKKFLRSVSRFSMDAALMSILGLWMGHDKNLMGKMPTIESPVIYLVFPMAMAAIWRIFGTRVQLKVLEMAAGLLVGYLIGHVEAKKKGTKTDLDSMLQQW